MNQRSIEKTNSTKLEYELTENIHVLLRSLLYGRVPNHLHNVIINKVLPKCLEDVISFSEKDPAAKNNPFYVLNCRSSYRSVAAYRVAHEIIKMENYFKKAMFTATLISETAKIQLGIEIHPSAHIGRRLVIDHGIGTVIGETTEIGDDCYILQCVILGARGISSNPNTKRHPTIGNRVQLGAFARVLGPILVGDDCFIGPHCLITQNVERGASVTLVTSQQIMKHQKYTSNSSLKLMEAVI